MSFHRKEGTDMRGIALTTGLLAAVISTAAFAQGQVPPALTATAATSQAPAEQTAPVMITDNTIICIYQRPTGTLLTDRVCRTHRAWALMKTDAQEWMEFGNRGSHQSDENGGGS